MIVYLYRNYVSSDKEKLQEKINELIATETMSIAQVEVLGAEKWEDVEEIQLSAHDIFSYMDEGYIFLNHIGKE